MRAIVLLASPLLLLACSGDPECDRHTAAVDAARWEGREDLLAEICPQYAPDGYEFVSMNRVKNLLSIRHQGERITAQLTPNELYCSFESQRGKQSCYYLLLADLSPGGGIRFCRELGAEEITDLVLEE